MSTAQRSYFQITINELTTKKETTEKDMRDAEDRLRQLQSDICLSASSSLRDLLLDGLRCISRIFGYDAEYFEGYLKSESETSDSYDLFIDDAVRAGIRIFRDGIESGCIDELEQWCQKLDDFKSRELSCLNTEDPFRNALQSLCTVASLGSRRITQLISRNCVEGPVVDMHRLADLERRFLDGSDNLRDVCRVHSFDEDRIKKSSEDLLNVREGLSILRGRIAQNEALCSAVEYTEDTVLRIVSYYNAFADAQKPMDWYRKQVENGRLPAIDSTENSSFQRDLDRLPSLWKSCAIGIRSTVKTGHLSNPFQLLSLMDNHIGENADLYQSASYYAHLFFRGMTEMHSAVHNPSKGPSHYGMTDEESQCFHEISDVCVDLSDMNLVHAKMPQIQEIFTRLENQLRKLSDEMIQTRRDPRPFLVQYIGSLHKQWYFECVLCITRALQKKTNAEQSFKPLSERLAAAKHKVDDLKSAIILADFQDMSSLQATLSQAKMSTVLEDFSDHEIEVLKSTATLVSQLLSGAGQKMLKKWRACHALPSSVPIEVFEEMVGVSTDLMRRSAPQLLSTNLTFDDSTERILVKTSSYLMHLCQTNSREMREFSSTMIEELKECGKEALRRLSVCQNYDEQYKTQVSSLFKADDEVRPGEIRRWRTQGFSSNIQKLKLGQELRRKAEDTADLYAKFWREVDACHRREMRPKWYATPRSVYLNQSKRLQDILEKQESVRRQSTVRKPINMKKKGLELVPLVVEVDSWDIDVQLFESCGGQVTVTCEGGEDGPFYFNYYVRPSSIGSMVFVVSSPATFTLLVTVQGDDQLFSTMDRFPLDQLCRSHDMTVLIGRLGGCHIRFRAATHHMYMVVASSAIHDPSMAKHAHAEEAYQSFSDQLQNCYEQYDDLYSQFESCQKSEKESGRLVEEADRARLRQESQRKSVESSWHAKAVMNGKEFAEDVSQRLEEALKSLATAEAQTLRLNPIHDGIERLFGILQSPPDVSFRPGMKLLTAESSLANISPRQMEFLWNDEMQTIVEQLGHDIDGLRRDGHAAVLRLLKLYVTTVCQHAIDATSEEELKMCENHQQEWKTCLEKFLPPFDQEMLLHRESQLEMALSMGRARMHFARLMKQLGERMEITQRLGTTAMSILRGTQIRHTSKIMICEEDGALSLSSPDCVVNFGTVLHQNDVPLSTPSTHVYTVEVENRMSEAIHVHLSAVDSSSPAFHETASTDVVLYGKTSWHFRFSIDSGVTGRIAETWKITSKDGRLDAKFKMIIEVQRLAVQLSTDAIDFGTVITNSQDIEETLHIKNVTDFPLLVKSQVQFSQTGTRFILSPQSFQLDARSSQSLTVTMRPGDVNEKVDSQMILGIVGNLKHIPMTVQVMRPLYELETDTGNKIEGTMFRLPVAPPGRRTKAVIRIRNTGTVPVVYRLSLASSVLEVAGKVAGTVRANETSSDISLSMKSSFLSCTRQELIIQIDGCIEKRLVIEGKWIEPMPSFLKRDVDFEVERNHLDAIAQGCTSITLSAVNTVENKTDVHVTIYPPGSEHFTFDRDCYLLDPNGTTDIVMYWKVQTLEVMQSTVVFCTENQKKIRFTVRLVMPEVNKVICQSRSLFFDPLNVGQKKTKGLSITTKKPISIKTCPVETPRIQSLSLKLKMAAQGSGSSAKGSWLFGSDDMPPKFHPKNNCVVTQIELNTGKTAGWIVETLQIQSEDDFLIRDDLSLCHPRTHNMVLMTYVGQDSLAARQMMQLRAESRETSKSPRSDWKNCLPDLHLLSAFQLRGSTVQAFFLLLLCEVQMLKPVWTLSDEQAEHILDSDFENIPDECAQHTGDLIQEADDQPGTSQNRKDHSASVRQTSQNFKEYFERVCELLKSDDQPCFGDTCLPSIILDDLALGLQRMAAALYMLRADCREDQQWKAAIACLSDTITDASSSYLFEKCGREMWECCSQNEQQTMKDCLKRVRGILVHDLNERIEFFEMMEDVPQCGDGVQDSESFGQRIAKSLTELCPTITPAVITHLMTMKTWSIGEIDLVVVKQYLAKAEMKGVIDGLCSGTAAGVFDAFCVLAKSRGSGTGDAIVHHLMNVLLDRKQDSDNPVGVVDTPVDSKNITQKILQSDDLKGLVYPLSMLHLADYRTVQHRRRYIQQIAIELFFGQINDIDIPDANLTLLKESVSRITNSTRDMETAISEELHEMDKPHRQEALKRNMPKIVGLDVVCEGAHRLIAPLRNLVVEWFGLEGSGGDDKKRREILDKKAESLSQVLTVLKPETLSSSTNPFDLASRVLQLVASVKTTEIAKPEVVNGLAQVAADCSLSSVLSLCRTLAQEISDVDVLSTVLDLVEEEQEKERLERKIVEAVFPKEHHDLFVLAIDLLINDGTAIDDGTQKAIYEICDKEAFDTLISLLKIAKAKASVSQMDGEERMMLSGLLEIKSLMDHIASFEKWSECRKKSDVLKEIFFSLYACVLPDELSAEARIFSKMALLLSLHRYFADDLWKTKEALYDTRSIKLEFEIADVPAASYPVVKSDEDDDGEIAAEDGSVVLGGDTAAAETSAAASTDGTDWKWFLSSVDVPSNQVTLLSKSTSHDSVEEDESTEIKSDDPAESSTVPAISFQSLETVEDALKDVSKCLKIQQGLESSHEEGSLTIVTFGDMIHAIVHLKETTEQWCSLFEKAVHLCRHSKPEEDETVESRIVCAGIDIVFLFQFLQQYLEAFSLLKMPDAMQPVCHSVVHCLNAIPRKKLPEELRSLLKEAGATEAFHGYTKEFNMPPTNDHHSRTSQRRSSTSDSGPKTRRSEGSNYQIDTQDGPDQGQEKSSFYDCLNSTAAAVDGSQREGKASVVLEGAMGIKIDPDAKLWTPRAGTRPTEDAVDNVEARGTFKLPEHLAWNSIGVLGQTTSSGERIQRIQNPQEDDFELFTGAVDDDAALIRTKVDFSREAISKQAEQMSGMPSLYRHDQEISAATDLHPVEDPVHAESTRLDNWTYQLLLDNATFTKCLKTIMHGLQKGHTELYKAVAERHVIEWCLLVDNSGSMITKEHQMKEALVLVMEMLHRLEFHFAVALFGDSTSQRMLKLIKDPFTVDIGQQIIDAFTFDEGTFPASAVRNVAQKVWPLGLSQEEKRQNHRVMLMIVDGLTQERKRADYLSVCREKDISLTVLNIHDNLQKDLMTSIRALWKNANAQSAMLHVKEVDSLPKVLVSLMEQQMGVIYKSIKDSHPHVSAASSVLVVQNIPETDFSVVDFDAICGDFGKNVLPALPGQFTRESFFECGYHPGVIPFAEEMGELVTGEIESFLIDIENLADNLQRQYDNLLNDSTVREHLKTAEKAWTQTEERLGSEIGRVAEALESFLPPNAFNRKRADVKGPTIHIPGYIKHLATQGSEKKIFANKKGGGRAEYAIVLLLDISVSMKHGINQTCALETLLLMIGALQQMNIDSFSVVLFAEQIYPIKLPDMAWEDVCIAMLMKTVEQIREPATMDADALLFAAELLESSNSRGPKKIFVMTDGYGSSGVRLAAALSKLEASGIDVLAMSVGPEVSFVKSCYNKWITAAFPHLLPNAIERMESTKQTMASKESESHEDSTNWLNLRLLPQSTNESVRAIFEKQERAFSDLTPMRKEREARLIRGNRPSRLSVDICFCMDCTGSMGRWMKAAAEQIDVSLTS